MPVEQTAMTKARIEKWKALEEQGISRTEISKRYGVSRQLVCKLLGPLQRDGGAREIHIYAVPELFDKAVGVAARLGLYHHGGQTAGQGSVGRLVNKIGSGEYIVIPAGTVERNGNEDDPSAETDAA